MTLEAFNPLNARSYFVVVIPLSTTIRDSNGYGLLSILEATEDVSISRVKLELTDARHDDPGVPVLTSGRPRNGGEVRVRERIEESLRRTPRLGELPVEAAAREKFRAHANALPRSPVTSRATY